MFKFVCNFCGKDQDAVKAIVAADVKVVDGKVVSADAICDECVEMAQWSISNGDNAVRVAMAALL